MKKVLIIDTTWPINSRTERFKNSLKKKFDVIVCAWNRGKKNDVNIENTYILESNIGYGNQLKKLFKLPVFVWYACCVYRKTKPHVIFASHWDSLICAVIIKILCNWKLKIIYDCLDLPTFSNVFIRNLLVWVERVNLNFVSLTIFASRYFQSLYSNKLESYVFENYPSINSLGTAISMPNWMEGYDEELLKKNKNIAWIGVVRYFDIIENILFAIKDTDICFFVFGDGPDLNKVKKAVSDNELNSQVFFFGRYSSSDIRYIYELSGLVWAAYPTHDFNAIYAISNKYFECSFFEKKIILSKKTKMANNLIGHPSIIQVDEYSSLDIREKILSNINLGVNEYCKYEFDTLWEEREIEFLDFLEEMLRV